MVFVMQNLIQWMKSLVRQGVENYEIVKFELGSAQKI